VLRAVILTFFKFLHYDDLIRMYSISDYIQRYDDCMPVRLYWMRMGPF
jgi:hypothetical protein